MAGVISDDVFGGEAPVEEPERWRPPAVCPECGHMQTRFVRLVHEMSVYVCDVCGAEFEVDEGEG